MDDQHRESFDAQQQALLEYATEFVVFVGDQGDIAMAAGPASAVLGYGETERRGRHIAEHLHPDDLPEILDLIERVRRDAELRETVHARARHKDGSWRMFEATVIAVNGHPVLGTGAVLRVRDVTDMTARTPSQGQEDRFLSLAESLPSGILSADRRGWVVYCNHAAQQILNLPADRIHGRGWQDVVAAEDLPDVMDASGLVARSGVPQQATFRIETGLFARWATARFVPLGDDKASGWIATLDDITDRRRAESQLAHRATHDPLTELPNRTLLEDRLEQACARLRREPTWLTVFFVDLDDFKAVNDTFGHTVGDEVLCEVARRLRAVLRPADTVSRLGGDEFVALCEGISETEAPMIAERIRDAIAVSSLVAGQEVTMRASVGWSSTCDTDAEPAELLVRADQAMYREKRGHRDAS